MTEQYLRRVVLKTNGQTFIDADGAKPEGSLRVRFAIRKVDYSTPNTCNVIVTNLSPRTANKARTEYKNISLFAGYGDNVRQLFNGEVIQVRVGREDITDTYMHILARSMERARNYAVVNSALSAGHTYRDRVNVAAQAMNQFGVKVGYIGDLGKKKFPRNYICHGMAKDLLREVCEGAGASWSIQDGRLQVLKNNELLPGQAIVLNSDSSLIGRPVQTIQGIEGRCLLNGLIVPGVGVRINESSIERAEINPAYKGEGYNAQIQRIAADGNYKIQYVEHSGDTHGQDFYTDFIGIAAGDPISKALASRGITDANGL